MPSVMDNIRFRNRFVGMSTPQRNQFITDTVSWLESEIRASVKSEHLSFLVDFENELQSQLNIQTIPPIWFQKISTTYGSFPFYDRFIQRSK